MSDTPEYSRRELLRQIGASTTLMAAGAGALSAQDMQHVHQAVAQETATGPYRPKALMRHEYATLERLSDLIIPADSHSEGALAANSAAFIDFLCGASEEMKGIYTGGLAWIDERMRKQYDSDFLSAQPGQQTALLDQIAYRKNDQPDLSPGVQFFDWARRMVVDAYYTSAIGMKELGYMGNGAMDHFSVPENAVEYALKRSPFA
ncbi:MAG TPA: gluconate 2-dehydrogenase subunit 3 family protein [Bryobacteraceae bacterium]|nr:gluconate 2-dehydrogenase subunit 3 family protein [Bryobacteraceae bacterium]